jgi:CHAT domain-containing protein
MHFAGPAVLDDASPMSSFFGLSSATSQRDAFLQSREIMNLESTAELVVASTAQQSADKQNPVSKARALHQSLLARRRSAGHQHPYYWAGFAMIGDAR